MPAASPPEVEPFVHATADVSEHAHIGNGTKIWNWTRVREGAHIGSEVTIGQHVYIDVDVPIGDRTKIQNSANIFHGVSIGADVFIGPAVCFTNDHRPRATGEWTVTPTVVHDGASIGANATIVCGIEIGTGAMVGAGSVVIDDVAPYTLVVGNPARVVGPIDEAGNRLGVERRRV